MKKQGAEPVNLIYVTITTSLLRLLASMTKGRIVRAKRLFKDFVRFRHFITLTITASAYG